MQTDTLSTKGFYITLTPVGERKKFTTTPHIRLDISFPTFILAGYREKSVSNTYLIRLSRPYMLVAGGADFLDLEAELSGSDRSGDESDQGEVGPEAGHFGKLID